MLKRPFIKEEAKEIHITGTTAGERITIVTALDTMIYQLHESSKEPDKTLFMREVAVRRALELEALRDRIVV